MWCANPYLYSHDSPVVTSTLTLPAFDYFHIDVEGVLQNSYGQDRTPDFYLPFKACPSSLPIPVNSIIIPPLLKQCLWELHFSIVSLTTPCPLSPYLIFKQVHWLCLQNAPCRSIVSPSLLQPPQPITAVFCLG